MSLPYVGDYNSRQRVSLALTSIVSILSLAAVVLRVVTRRLCGHRLRPSDYLMMVALLFGEGTTIMNYIDITNGRLGQHTSVLNASQLVLLSEGSLVVQILWAVCEGAFKASMCSLYMELFPVRRVHIYAWATLALCVMFALGSILGTFFVCEPTRAQWTPGVQKTCGNIIAFWMTICTLNIVTDIAILTIPLTVISTLKLKTPKRVALYCLFGLGFIVCGIASVRLALTSQVTWLTADLSWELALLNIWCILELHLSIIAGSVPVLGPLCSKMKDKFRGPCRDASLLGNHISSFFTNPTKRRRRQWEDILFSRTTGNEQTVQETTSEATCVPSVGTKTISAVETRSASIPDTKSVSSTEKNTASIV